MYAILSHHISGTELLCFTLVMARENKGTERDSEGVGWDMSIPQKLFIDWLLNGSLFPETSASIPFPLFFEVVFIDKT